MSKKLTFFLVGFILFGFQVAHLFWGNPDNSNVFMVGAILCFATSIAAKK